MNRTINTKFKRSNLIAAIIFLSSFFSFGVSAQQVKLMEAKSLAALTAEIKGIVERAEPDRKQSVLVARKWDARKDLAGKTKKEVVNLLYEDVKSTISDAGTRYQIYSIFSFYKQIPDEKFSGQRQPQMTSDSKPEAVERLTTLTFEEHPYVGIEEEIAKLPGVVSAKEIAEMKETERKQRIEVFEDALKANNKLTAEQKAFVRANFDRLSKTIDDIIDETIRVNFPTDQWVMEGLDRSYAAKFTLKELNDLIVFFDTENTHPVLKYIRQTELKPLITGNGGKLTFTAADLAEYDKFAATAPGKKFLAAYLRETKEYVALKEGEVRRNVPNADGFALLETENLNEFFNQFVGENYKK